MFSPFPATNYTDWMAQVQKDLKDANVLETLRWATPEGFLTEPYYTAEHLAGLPLDEIQTAQKATPGWLNAPFFVVSDEKITNAVLRNALAAGAEALILQLPADAHLAQVLAGIKLSETPVYFHVEGDVIPFLDRLRQLAPYQLRGGIISNHDSLAEATQRTADSPLFRTVTIDGGAFHNAGATATQELAFTLANLADVYDDLTNNGLTIDRLVPKTTISMAVGTSYFMEIAKLRALRVLLARFNSAYTSGPIVHSSLYNVHCFSSAFHESTATPYTNLLRATTEAMAAVIGGCNVLTVRPYDAVMGQPAEFSQRIARNISVLMKAESYLDKVADPSAGSYYAESLTHQLTEAAWALFLDVEKRGGFAKASEFVQAELDQSYQEKVAAVQAGRVLVGVTKFRHDEGETNALESDGNGIDRRLAKPFE